MKRPAGLRGIAYCYFASHDVQDQRRISYWRLVIFAILPIAVGVILLLKFGAPPTGSLSLIAAVFSVVAAVLLGLLPLSHSIIGQSDTKRVYTEGDSPLAEQELNRVRTLQDLQAAISWAVILLVIGLAACLILALLPRATAAAPLAWWNERLLQLVSAMMYSITASTALSFFDVAAGVFEGMESHAEAVKACIKNNTKSGRQHTETTDIDQSKPC